MYYQIKEENNLPKEDMSFPTFKYKEIVNEDWENSDFKDILEHKFLFVFFQATCTFFIMVQKVTRLEKRPEPGPLFYACHSWALAFHPLQ